MKDWGSTKCNKRLIANNCSGKLLAIGQEEAEIATIFLSYSEGPTMVPRVRLEPISISIFIYLHSGATVVAENELNDKGKKQKLLYLARANFQCTFASKCYFFSSTVVLVLRAERLSMCSFNAVQYNKVVNFFELETNNNLTRSRWEHLSPLPKKPP